MKPLRALPQSLEQPLKVSKFVQLYLIKRYDQFKFKFIDMLSNQFTVQIGPQIKCNCIPGYYDHCIHSFYVLQKIFKVKEDDPLLWKQKYSAKDLQALIESEKGFAAKVKKQQILRNLKTMNLEFDIQMNQSLIKLEERQNKQLSESFVFQQQPITKNPKNQLQESSIKKFKQSDRKLHDQLLHQAKLEVQKQQLQLFGQQQPLFCPICHQNITYQTPAFQCKQQCRNYFHIKCLKFWVKHQRKNIIENDRLQDQHFETRFGIKVTCPMCRNKFPENVQKLMTQAELRFKKFYQSHNIKCNQCNQDICLKLYHCLLCKDWNLCDLCYKGWKHQHHDRFLMKANKKAAWAVPNGRSAFNMSKLEFSLEYIKKLSKNSVQSKLQGQVKQLFGENYSKYVQSNLPKPDIIQYLKQTFINIEKQIHKTYKPVDYNQQTLKCVACKKHSIVGMRRMNCTGKHFVDEKCLNFFLKNNFLKCPLDKSFILQGLDGIQINLKNTGKSTNKIKH